MFALCLWLLFDKRLSLAMGDAWLFAGLATAASLFFDMRIARAGKRAGLLAF